MTRDPSFPPIDCKPPSSSNQPKNRQQTVINRPKPHPDLTHVPRGIYFLGWTRAWLCTRRTRHEWHARAAVTKSPRIYPKSRPARAACARARRARANRTAGQIRAPRVPRFDITKHWDPGARLRGVIPNALRLPTDGEPDLGRCDAVHTMTLRRWQRLGARKNIRLNLNTSFLRALTETSNTNSD